jgi:CubicO group peptidase (beta-lactamase class C family)
MTETTNGYPSGAPFAQGYMTVNGAPPAPYSLSWFYGDGDIVSTASDIARFDIALMSGKLVSPATFALMQSPTVDASSIAPGVRYGLGLLTVSSGVVTFVGHHGGIPGYAAENEMLPASGFAMVVLSNAFDFVTPLANNAVLSVVAPDTLPHVPTATPAVSAAAVPEDPAVTAKLRAFYAGLARGQIDRSTVAESIDSAMPESVMPQVQASLAPLGAIRDLTYLGKTPQSSATVYVYRATFSSGMTKTAIFVLEATTGKIAQLLFQ